MKPNLSNCSSMGRYTGKRDHLRRTRNSKRTKKKSPGMYYTFTVSFALPGWPLVSCLAAAAPAALAPPHLLAATSAPMIGPLTCASFSGRWSAITTSKCCLKIILLIAIITTTTTTIAINISLVAALITRSPCRVCCFLAPWLYGSWS